MAGKRSTREEQAEVSRIVAKKLKISLEDANELLGRDDDILETYEKIGGVVPRTNKKGGSVSRKKGGTASRKGGGKIMVGYKAGGKV
jgi:hypothetical protein